jgi:uncharacterized protein (DUF433 family)
MEREITPSIVSNPEIMGGRHILKGHRIAVAQLLAQLAGGMTLAEIQADYQLSDEEMRAILNYRALQEEGRLPE